MGEKTMICSERRPKNKDYRKWHFNYMNPHRIKWCQFEWWPDFGRDWDVWITMSLFAARFVRMMTWLWKGLRLHVISPFGSRQLRFEWWPDFGRDWDPIWTLGSTTNTAIGIFPILWTEVCSSSVDKGARHATKSKPTRNESIENLSTVLRKLSTAECSWEIWILAGVKKAAPWPDKCHAVITLHHDF